MQRQADKLFEDQITGWPLLGENWGKLDAAVMRRFDFDGFSIRVQFNPERIGSSAARVDPLSIEKRPCFLCEANRPPEEDFVAFGNDYEILCNPFPIFRKHYTIAMTDHKPQVIDSEFPRMLELSKSLPELVIFYNAPGCGASAPDHMHFQAGNLGFMPIEDELDLLMERHGTSLIPDQAYLIPDQACRLTGVDDGLRRFFVLESESKKTLEAAFGHISDFTRQLGGGGEPMLNILAYFREKWRVLVFPREKHRPWQYFQDGEKNILLSPASVDMGGVLITPMEKDFRKLCKDDIVDIFTQVCLDEKHFHELTSFLSGEYA